MKAASGFLILRSRHGGNSVRKPENGVQWRARASYLLYTKRNSPGNGTRTKPVAANCESESAVIQKGEKILFKNNALKDQGRFSISPSWRIMASSRCWKR